jgi:hypothetical protein
MGSVTSKIHTRLGDLPQGQRPTSCFCSLWDVSNIIKPVLEWAQGSLRDQSLRKKYLWKNKLSHTLIDSDCAHIQVCDQRYERLYLDVSQFAYQIE